VSDEDRYLIAAMLVFAMVVVVYAVVLWHEQIGDAVAWAWNSVMEGVPR
jgi:hypothetical protein